MRSALLCSVFLALGAIACSNNEPTQPSTPADPSLTITISSTGASPRALVVPRGSQVTFINHDSVPHQMYSDPHPEHTDCPEFDSVGNLSPGQSRTTTNLVATGTCHFHDHLNFANTALRGSVQIQ
jgi:hypothetical protein